ncbi:hypothetical protein [Oceanobacillus alkalisoli]|uniref:hypothetical protein n=1 Tax=Oceanobacillus alkalisoli TaxID=2925113 RepID=UPI001EE4BA6B|nr:hypothetical protein [Oceanobacillus alkalisoli]MCG5104416.1 hypothetical protein [Oceanobacillus alkalisoli]
MDENLIKHIYHPFYKKVDKLVDDVRLMQLQKGAEKYPEPFTPSNWTGKELAIHALQELRDGQVYVVGLLERIEELETHSSQVSKRIRELIPQDLEDYVEIMMLLDELEGTE